MRTSDCGTIFIGALSQLFVRLTYILITLLECKDFRVKCTLIFLPVILSCDYLLVILYLDLEMSHFGRYMFFEHSVGGVYISFNFCVTSLDSVKVVLSQVH